MTKLLAIFALVLSALLYLWLAAGIFQQLYFNGWDGLVEGLAATAWDGWMILAGVVVTATILLGIGLSLLGENSRP